MTVENNTLQILAYVRALADFGTIIGPQALAEMLREHNELLGRFCPIKRGDHVRVRETGEVALVNGRGIRAGRFYYDVTFPNDPIRIGPEGREYRVASLDESEVVPNG